MNNIRRKNLTLKWSICFAVIFVVTIRFIYIFFIGEKDVEGNFFGFTWLSVFIYTFGAEVSYLFFALILAYATRFMEENAKKPFIFLSYVISFVGLFFISWIFLEAKEYSTKKELIISFIASTTIIFVVYYMSRFINNNQETVEKLKSKIRFVMNKMIVESVKNKHIINKERWKEEIVDPTLDKLDE